jgi:hypothetical protein
MPDKKIFRKPKNLSLHPTISSRGFEVARRLGYDASEAVEKFLELLNEEYVRMRGRHKPGDPLQLTFIDRLEEKPKAKEKKR